MGSAIAARFVAPAEHSGEGGAAEPTHGSKYEQPAMSVISPALSAEFAHPLPALAVLVCLLLVMVNVGGGRVGTAAVGV